MIDATSVSGSLNIFLEGGLTSFLNDQYSFSINFDNSFGSDQIENVTAGSGNDRVTGNGVNNIIHGVS